jgi:crotonobetainyl-CoA:carnitine CoA-transferase CaiB-like acyl-CoA transferase
MTSPGQVHGAGPLAGVRILDFTRMFAGPLGTQTLADLGADIIKIEEPRIGDPTRRNPPYTGTESLYNLSLNRGKRSVAVNLKEAAGKKVVRLLVRTADILVENFRPGVMRELGLGYAELNQINPALVYCSLSGFGATGHLQERASFDLVNQAMSGVLDVTGPSSGRPVRIGVPLGDIGGGLFLAAGALAGLEARRRFGGGCYLDLSLHDVLYSMLLDRTVSPERGRRDGNRHPRYAPHGIYRVGDGYVAVAATSDQGWKAAVGVLEVPELGDPVFGTAAGRKQHEDRLDAVLTRELANWSTTRAVSQLAAPDLFAAPVLTLGQIIDSDLAGEDALLEPTPHPAFPGLHSLLSPICLDGQRLGERPIARRLGADTRAILDEAGISSEEIELLLQSGVARCADEPPQTQAGPAYE